MEDKKPKVKFAVDMELKKEDKLNMDSVDIGLYNRLGRLCMGIQIFIAILGLLGYIPGIRLLGSVRPGYIPMAISTALFFLLLGLISIFYDNLNRRLYIITAEVFSAFVAFFGALVFTQYLLGQKESFELRFVNISEKLGDIPVGIMSHSTGVVFFFAGLSVFLILLNKLTVKKNNLFAHLAGICASIVFGCGAIFVLGYLYNQPFLYGKGSVVPMALTTAIAFCFLGLGQMFFVSYAYPLVALVGSGTKKILTLQIFPAAVILFIVFIARDMSSIIFNINNAVLVSISSIISVCVIVFTIMRTSSAVNSAIETLARFPSESPNPVLRIDDKDMIIYANNSAKEMLAYWEIGSRGLAPEKWKELIKAARENKKVVQEELGLGGKVFLFTVIPIIGKGYSNVYTIDVTGRKQAEEALKESEAKFKTLFNESADGMLLAEPETRKFAMCNLKICQMLGYSKEELMRMRVDDIHPENDLPFVIEQFEEQVKKIIKVASGLPVKRKDGSVFYADISTSTIILSGKKYLMGSFRDITDRKKTEEEREFLLKEIERTNKKLEQLSLRDSHTGLYNHRYFMEAIEVEFERARRNDQPLSTMMLDIDYFKSINDVYGHQFGDLILKQFATRLKRLVRRYDVVIRYGGEEFIVISPGTKRADALNLARRILDALNLYNFGDKKHTVKLKLSIAVASCPDDNVINGMDLMGLTDRILTKVKEGGGNRVYSSLDMEMEKVLSVKESTNVKFMEGKIERLTKRANQSLVEAIFAFAKTIELKDRYTGEHGEKTVQFATSIARQLNLSKYEIELIRQAAILHDLGKIGISEKILLKKGKLTKEEFDEIKKHPQIAADILRPIQFLHPLIPLILHHHERWDGKGYPHGLKGERIPVGARVLALADHYQALISDRPYRKAFPEKEAVKIIKKGSGTQFCPKAVAAFLKILKKK